DKDKIDRTVLDILKLEGIKINPAKKNSDYLEIRIKGKSSDNKIVISKNKIKNIEEAVDRIIKNLRSAEIKRKTKETDITIKLELDGEGKAEIETGIGFFNHMIEQIARHANLNLTVEVKGDLNIDEHHTIEDTGIALGEALRKALGDKKGIKRFGFMLPMDDSVAVCAIDLSGRNFLNFNCKFQREKVGEFPTELTEEFFRGLTIGLMANIYIKAEGKNDHHKIESIFKAFAKALNEACRIDPRAKGLLPSTKGKL
ncbi:MAG: imidazoleglycerol-phosphate dehydratase HisB, partial [Melioribacter sp.]|nr:imidazoleglycerol-phosphate dehydratase HisB [Melioribacter sp.]